MNAIRIDISILIVGYNSSAYLAECIGSIERAVNQRSYEVLFVNNGSDGSEITLQQEFPEIRVFDHIGNVGFAAGNNYLANQAVGQWYLLLNPDTQLQHGAVDELLDVALRHQDFQVFGGVTVGRDGRPLSRADLELPSFSRLVLELLGIHRHTIVRDTSLELIEVEAMSGGFMLVRKEWWNRLYGMDESFFLYAEELDFFKRLNNAGGRSAKVIKSRIFHDMGSGDVYSPSRIQFMVTGNAHYFHKHFSSPYAYACLFIMWLIMIKRYIGGAILAREGDRYARLSRGFSKVARAPWLWMRGYRSNGADPRKRAGSSVAEV